MKDYYKILEVNPTASQEIISKVYKVLAKKYHPDLQDASNVKEAEEKFKEISEAYDVLSHADQRQQYDEEYAKEQNANSIDINKFLELQEYCKQLESQLSSFNRTAASTAKSSTSNINQSSYDLNYNNVVNQAYNDAVNKAYNDTYYNTLKNMGYKIRYQKTFKERFKNFISLIIFCAIIYLLLQIPAVQNYIKSLFVF